MNSNGNWCESEVKKSAPLPNDNNNNGENKKSRSILYTKNVQWWCMIKWWYNPLELVLEHVNVEQQHNRHEHTPIQIHRIYLGTRTELANEQSEKEKNLNFIGLLNEIVGDRPNVGCENDKLLNI